MPSKPLGFHSKPEMSLPQVPDFRYPLFEVEEDNATPAEAFGQDRVVDLTASRYGLGNTIHLQVDAPIGTKISLYEKEGTDYFFVETHTTTALKEVVRFFDLAAQKYVVVLTDTGVANGAGAGTIVTINGGGTK